MSTSIVVPGIVMPPTPPEIMALIRSAAEVVKKLPPIKIQTEHLLHAGIYTRTVRAPANAILVNVVIKIPTVFVVHGRAAFFAGDRWYRIEDYQVIPTRAGRQNICVTMEPTEMTMIFQTKAKTIEEAEDQFTDEADKLISRTQGENDLILITGVESCLE
jgi:hypothetical protein